MIRALLVRGLRQHLGLWAILCLSLSLFQWVIVWVAARIVAGPGFEQLLAALLPPGAFNAVIGQLGFTSLSGAISFGFQHPFNLVAAIAMVVVVGTLPAQERESGLLDLILSRPVTRTRYLTASGLLTALACLLPPVALLGGVRLGLLVVDAPETITWSTYLPAAVGFGLLLSAIGAYTLLLATFAKRRGVATARAVGLTLLFYWLDFMGNYWEVLEKPRLLSPFHYFDPAASSTSGFHTLHALVLLGISLAAGVGALFSFQHQDL